MNGFSGFGNSPIKKERVKNITVRKVKDKNGKHKSTLTSHTSITPLDPDSNNKTADIKKKSKTKISKKGRRTDKYKSSILTIDPKGNATATIEKSKIFGKGTKIKDYKGKKAIRKHKRFKVQ